MAFGAMIFEQDGAFGGLGMRCIYCRPEHRYQRQQNPDGSLHRQSLLEIMGRNICAEYTIPRAGGQYGLILIINFEPAKVAHKMLNFPRLWSIMRNTLGESLKIHGNRQAA
jgi:hypothetical protein